MNSATFFTATLVAAGVSRRVYELNLQSTAMCAAIGMGAGIVVWLLARRGRHV